MPRLWPESTIVCLATGSSLTELDVNACRGVCDAAGRPWRFIAIKDSYRLAPWADVLFASDARWWKHYKGVPEFSGLKYALEPQQYGPISADFDALPSVTVLRHTGLDGLEREPHAIRHGWNSGYQAVNLAVHLGARRIILLGYDMKPGPNGWHFFGPHPWQIDIPFDLFLQQFERIVAPLAEIGVEVINATRQTALTCFPRQPLEACLRESAV